MHKALTVRDVLSSAKVTNAKQTWTVQNYEQYFKLCVISHCGT